MFSFPTVSPAHKHDGNREWRRRKPVSERKYLGLLKDLDKMMNDVILNGELVEVECFKYLVGEECMSMYI